MTEITHRRSRGFTLIEVVVALLVFAALSVMAWQGLYQIIQIDQRSRQQVAEQNDVNRAWAIIVQDLLHMRSRPVRDQFGDFQPAYETQRSSYVLRFSRGGLPIVEGLIPTGMQRIAYQLTDEGDLLRWTWPLLDGYSQEGGISQVLLSGVTEVEFEQLDRDNYFQPNWPPINQATAPGELPRMIRFSLQMEDGLGFDRLVPGLDSFPQSSQTPATGNGQGEPES
jgi:general secretion pathway protein J